jgi:hypothetical protein
VMEQEHPAVMGYIRTLEEALWDLSREQRHEIVGEIRDHLRESLGAKASESDVLNAIERLGEPGEIAAEARGRFGVRPRRAGALEIVTIILLLVGALLIPVVGWLIGIVLLWVSDFWGARDKALGTLAVPGGLALPLFLGALAVDPATGPLRVLAYVIFALAVILPLFTAYYLGRKVARSRRAASATTLGLS